MMASFEMDPLFTKALRLLHSRSKDSTNQLRQLLEDTLAKRRGDKKKDTGDKSKEKGGDEKQEAEKRKLEELKKDLTDLSGEPVLKKSKTDSSEDNKKESIRNPDKEKGKLSEKRNEGSKSDNDRNSGKDSKGSSVVDVDSDSNNESNLDAGDFAFDMGISCVVCRQFDVSSGNQLLECQECHSLYHQECHKPPVTAADVNDPRFVWYCYKCSKNMKKLVQNTKVQKSKASPSSGKEKELKGTRVDVSPQLPFRRQLEPIKSSSVKETGTNKGAGLAALANLSGSKEKPSGLKTFDFLNIAQQNSGSKPEKTSSKLNTSLTKSGPSSKLNKSSDNISKTTSKHDASRSKMPVSGTTKPVSSTNIFSKLESQKSIGGCSSKPSTSTSGSSSFSSKANSSGGISKTSSGATGSSKSSPGGSTSAGSQQTTTAMGAAKRMEIMKKKAAAKLQEKRTMK